jgi:muramidase (phage lysozyme)
MRVLRVVGRKSTEDRIKLASKLTRLGTVISSKRFRRQAILTLAALISLILLWQIVGKFNSPPRSLDYTPPLVMQTGNPYVRALMRTLSASEANDENPYTALYGGQHFSDFSRHPDQCIAIVSGPNQGECTTAAGRYQILSSTWKEKVQRYHPQHGQDAAQPSYRFEPQSQDEVVYAWLSDPEAWDINIPESLEQGKLDLVLRHLSQTWTSLGYGIEDNSATPLLPQVYQKALAEELAQSKTSTLPQPK